jgi:hypothetical protein
MEIVKGDEVNIDSNRFQGWFCIYIVDNLDEEEVLNSIDGYIEVKLRQKKCQKR